MMPGSLSVSIEPRGYVVLALLTLILPVQWLAAALVSAAFHELCHLTALHICKASVFGLRIGIGGAQIVTGPMENRKELLCTLAGPFGSLCLVLLWEIFPRTAICAALHCAYNLLPLYPLDGGRALKCITHMLFPAQYANKIIMVVQGIVLAAACILAGYASFCLRLGVLPLIFAWMLIHRAGVLKIPCKRA